MIGRIFLITHSPRGSELRALPFDHAIENTKPTSILQNFLDPSLPIPISDYREEVEFSPLTSIGKKNTPLSSILLTYIIKTASKKPNKPKEAL